MVLMMLQLLCLIMASSVPGGESLNLNLHRSPLVTSPMDKPAGRTRRSLVPRQSLPGSVGFAVFSGRQFDILPFQGIVPHTSQPANQQSRLTGSTNQRGRHTVSTNQSGRKRFAPTNHGARRSVTGGSALGRTGIFAALKNIRNKSTRQHLRSPPRRQFFQNSKLNSITRQIFQIKQTTRDNSVGTKSVLSGLSRFQQKPSRNVFLSSITKGSGSGGSGLRGSTRTTSASPIGIVVTSHGLQAHSPPNAQNMETFLIQRKHGPGHYVDGTAGTGTLLSSRRGQCPVVDQSRCPPLPSGPLPPSCSNDYQCREPTTKCCYDPCLTVSKCVRPVGI
ncbi:uncharacterized protein LOC122368884 isoform X1 [Amphibalanus amphitrite]|uniref:uncharacterized protein LOC122368884 isoform X1 n=1 Tax=Amphibalanus amphitrite TaxID=1232801 RepID=UPI001C910503|nr:uncharacterized protein LOC122368884 isoform X1 [Amphibalanus amphitrite]